MYQSINLYAVWFCIIISFPVSCKKEQKIPDIAETAADAGIEIPDAGEIQEILPDPKFIFEEKKHPNCIADHLSGENRSQFIRTETELPDLNVLSVLPEADKIWAGTGSGLFLRKNAENFTQVFLPQAKTAVNDLNLPAKGGILAAAGNQVLEIDQNLSVSVIGETENSVKQAFECSNKIYAVAGSDIYFLDNGSATVLKFPDIAQILCASCQNNSIWIGTEKSVWKVDNSSPVKIWDSSEPVLSIASSAEYVFANYISGIAKLGDSGIVQSWKPELASLPAGEIMSIAVSEESDKWASGHKIGISVYNPALMNFDHFHSLRYLPDEQINDLEFAPDGSLWAATDKGIARIYSETLSLSDKAEKMFSMLDKWFWRMDGFVATHAVFSDPWVSDNPYLYDDDNDGQYTEEAVGAFCYAYAVTKDEKYYQAAHKAVHNMFLLIDVPASDYEAKGFDRGFVSRSLIREDETELFQKMSKLKNWHLVHYKDGHDYLWKDDTSSDEVTGHFFGLSLYYDLCAKTDQERSEVADHLEALTSFIIANGFKLINLDGKQTTDGYWQPEKLAIALDGFDKCFEKYPFEDCIVAWGGSGFLNSIEILGGMLATWHVTGKKIYYETYEELIAKYRYDELAVINENVVTWSNKGLANYCDHELADLAFLTLVRYEPDESRRAKWIKSMLDAYEYEKGERNPLKALAMASALSDSPGLMDGFITLHEYPVDLREIPVDNSHRKDVLPDVADRFGNPQFQKVLPYDEIYILRWDMNPYLVKQGGSGNSWMSPSYWLLPYWGLRYYGAICDSSR